MMAPKPLSLRIGASKTIGEFVVAPKVERFLRAYPEASFSLIVDNTQVLLRMLEAGKLDFVLVEGFFDRERYEAQLYRQESFFGVCPPGHRLAGRSVPLDELAGERLIIREAGSGTRDGFETITDTKDTCVLAQELTSTGAVIEAVKGNPNAIGYASLSAVEGQEGIKALTVGGVACSEETVLDGTYAIQRPFVLVTKEGTALSAQAQAFFDFATSSAANDLIRAAGAVPVAE